MSVMVTGFYPSSRKSQDDTCLILYVCPLSLLLVVPAIFSAGRIPGVSKVWLNWYLKW